jgi:hypothetical protein
MPLSSKLQSNLLVLLRSCLTSLPTHDTAGHRRQVLRFYLKPYFLVCSERRKRDPRIAPKNTLWYVLNRYGTPQRMCIKDGGAACACRARHRGH